MAKKSKMSKTTDNGGAARPDFDGAADLPTDAELDALQAEIDQVLDEASKGAANKEAANTGAAKQAGADANANMGSASATDGATEPDASETGPHAQIETLKAELALAKDQTLRAMAEMENVKRRTEREVAQAKTFGIERFAQDVLSVVDNLSRALETVDGKVREDMGENAKNLLEGIELTEKDLMAVLARNGVKAVPGKGAKFDPNVHQAVANIPSDEEKGHVAEVMQTGFTIGDRTLRAAIVAVSTGPVKV